MRISARNRIAPKTQTVAVKTRMPPRATSVVDSIGSELSPQTIQATNGSAARQAIHSFRRALSMRAW